MCLGSYLPHFMLSCRHVRDKGEICKSTMQGLETFFAKSRAEEIGGEPHAPSAVLPRAAYGPAVWSETAAASSRDRQRGKEDMPLVSLQALLLLGDNHEWNTPLFLKQVKNEVSTETSTFFHVDSSWFCSTFSINVSCSYGTWVTSSVTVCIANTPPDNSISLPVNCLILPRRCLDGWIKTLKTIPCHQAYGR